jgi:hypothetical protein
MRHACRRLDAAPAGNDVYTDRHIEGLGKNFLREANRIQALAAYGFFIKFYALKKLSQEVRSAYRQGCADSLADLLTRPSDHPEWEHPRRILVEELGETGAVAALRQLPAMLEQVATWVERSRAKDDVRGSAIIPDYADVHPLAAEDSWVRQTWAQTRELQEEIQKHITWLNKCRARRTEPLEISLPRGEATPRMEYS